MTTTGQVQTVLGPIAADQLGFTLSHEHIVCGSPGVVRAWPALYGGREALLDRAQGILVRVREDGVRTMVDATTFDLGREVDLLVEASRASGVHIVAASGMWLAPSPAIQVRTTQQLTDWFTADVETGLDGTDVRAGIIKVASETELTPMEERILEAAARAHAATGVPILTHSLARVRMGEQQAAVLERFGVDRGRVVIGHTDDATDIDYPLALLDRGYLLGFDRLPNGRLPEYGTQTVEARMDMLTALAARGYADRIVLSHDDPIWAGVLSDEDQRRHIESNPDVISFIPRTVLPGLRERGVSEADIEAMTVRAPRRWLAGA
jgi:phosphotriesterase-related protein